MPRAGSWAAKGRNALIAELRAAGWSLRRIAEHPKVRLSARGVADVVKAGELRDRLRVVNPGLTDDELDDLAKRSGANALAGVGDCPPGPQVNPLELFRSAFCDRDPVAVAAWHEFEARLREAENAMALARHGCQFIECGFVEGQAIRDALLAADQERFVPAGMADEDV